MKLKELQYLAGNISKEEYQESFNEAITSISVNPKRVISVKGKKIEVYPTDAPKKMSWDQAVKWAKSLDPKGEWRLPTIDELIELKNQKKNHGTFKSSTTSKGEYFPAYYLSSTPPSEYRAWGYDFGEAGIELYGKSSRTESMNVRVVRDVKDDKK